jgi:hypothetical protein
LIVLSLSWHAAWTGPVNRSPQAPQVRSLSETPASVRFPGSELPIGMVFVGHECA